METTAAIKMPPFKVVDAGHRFDSRTKEGKRIKFLLNQTECVNHLVLLEPAAHTNFGVYTVWSADLLQGLANQINTHVLGESKYEVIVIEALQTGWSVNPIYMRYLVLQSDNTWAVREYDRHTELDRSSKEFSYLRYAKNVVERATQVQDLRNQCSALDKEKQAKDMDAQDRANAEACLVMPKREEYALRKAEQMLTSLAAKWEDNPIKHTSRPYEILERAEQAMQAQACQIILANVGKFNVDRTIYTRSYDKPKYAIITLDEVIAHLYQHWVTGFYTSEQPHAYQALKDLVNHIA